MGATGAGAAGAGAAAEAPEDVAEGSDFEQPAEPARSSAARESRPTVEGLAETMAEPFPESPNGASRAMKGYSTS